LFDLRPVDAREATTPGWVAGRMTTRGRNEVLMAPIARVSRGKAEAAQRIVVLHRCAEHDVLAAKVFGGSAEC
jgi:hypothetical protein